MIDFASSSLASLFDRHAGSLLKRVPLLLGSGFMWLTVLSIHQNQSPLVLIDQTVHWLGWSWSTSSLAEWLAARAPEARGVGLFVAIVAVLGVLHGAMRWLNETHGPSALAFTLVLWQQVDAQTPSGILIVVLLIGCAWWPHRSVEDVAIATVIFVTMLLLMPVFLLAGALGFSERRRADMQT